MSNTILKFLLIRKKQEMYLDLKAVLLGKHSNSFATYACAFNCLVKPLFYIYVERDTY